MSLCDMSSKEQYADLMLISLDCLIYKFNKLLLDKCHHF